MALPTTTTTIKKVALPSLPVPPRITLSVKKQEALTHETVIENGAEKDMQIMLKGKPYKFVLGLEDIQTGEPSSLDFTGITVKAHLHYDSPDNDRVKRREVQQMKTKTIDAVGQLSSNKKEYMLEVKIHTLSTQHEDQRFRVRFRAMEAATMQCIAGVESADSLPIRVISKPDVLRPRNTPKPKKRTFPEMMLEQMSELNRANRLLQEKVDLLLKTQASQPLLQHEQQQQQQQTLATTTTTTTTSSTSQAGLLNKVVKAEEDEEDFEALVRKAMSTYARMATEERASKLRKLVSSSSVSEEQTLSEFAHQLQQECQCDEQTKLANFQFSSDDLADFDKLSTTLCNTFEFADLGFEPSDMHFMNTCS